MGVAPPQYDVNASAISRINSTSRPVTRMPSSVYTAGKTNGRNGSTEMPTRSRAREQIAFNLELVRPGLRNLWATVKVANARAWVLGACLQSVLLVILAVPNIWTFGLHELFWVAPAVLVVYVVAVVASVRTVCESSLTGTMSSPRPALRGEVGAAAQPPDG